MRSTSACTRMLCLATMLANIAFSALLFGGSQGQKLPLLKIDDSTKVLKRIFDAGSHEVHVFLGHDRGPSEVSSLYRTSLLEARWPKEPEVPVITFSDGFEMGYCTSGNADHKIERYIRPSGMVAALASFQNRQAAVNDAKIVQFLTRCDSNQAPPKVVVYDPARNTSQTNHPWNNLRSIASRRPLHSSQTALDAFEIVQQLSSESFIYNVNITVFDGDMRSLSDLIGILEYFKKHTLNHLKIDVALVVGAGGATSKYLASYPDLPAKYPFAVFSLAYASGEGSFHPWSSDQGRFAKSRNLSQQLQSEDPAMAQRDPHAAMKSSALRLSIHGEQEKFLHLEFRPSKEASIDSFRVFLKDLKGRRKPLSFSGIEHRGELRAFAIHKLPDYFEEVYALEIFVGDQVMEIPAKEISQFASLSFGDWWSVPASLAEVHEFVNRQETILDVEGHAFDYLQSRGFQCNRQPLRQIVERLYSEPQAELSVNELLQTSPEIRRMTEKEWKRLLDDLRIEVALRVKRNEAIRTERHNEKIFERLSPRL